MRPLPTTVFLAVGLACATAFAATPQSKPEPAPGPRMKGAEKRALIESTSTVQARGESPGVAPKRDVAPLRNIARQMMTMERVHRERTARMNRLVELYASQQDFDKTKEVEALRQKESRRYEAAMAGYAKAVGPEAFAKIQAAMNAPVAAPARAPKPEPGPAREGAKDGRSRKPR